MMITTAAVATVEDSSFWPVNQATFSKAPVLANRLMTSWRTTAQRVYTLILFLAILLPLGQPSGVLDESLMLPYRVTTMVLSALMRDHHTSSLIDSTRYTCRSVRKTTFRCYLKTAFMK